jgi:hypothetical protein
MEIEFLFSTPAHYIELGIQEDLNVIDCEEFIEFTNLQPLSNGVDANNTSTIYLSFNQTIPNLLPIPESINGIAMEFETIVNENYDDQSLNSENTKSTRVSTNF